MIVQCKEEDVEKNGYRHTHSLTDMPHNDPAQYTVLGWVKTLLVNNSLNQNIKPHHINSLY